MLVTIAIAGLVVYRITHFIIEDTLIEGTRKKVKDWCHEKFQTLDKKWKSNVLQFFFKLLTCPYCVSVWLAFAPWPFIVGWDWWLLWGWLATAGVVCLIYDLRND